MRYKLVVLGLFFAISSGAAFAGDSSSGCGPGWYLFKENSLVSSALRATTNGVLFPVTTIGMTVGSSNCTQHKIVLKEQESLHFATMNHFELKNEAAKGEGEYLSAFATTIGCSEGVQQNFNRAIHQNFEKIYPKNHVVQPEKVLVEVYKVILSNDELVRQCSLVG